MPLLEGSSDDIIQKNIEMLISEGRSPEQAAAIAYEKAGRKPKANASEPTYEYLKKIWELLKEHPAVFDQIKEEAHKTARASAGGQMKAKYAHEMATNSLHFNNAEFGKVLYKDDDITVLATTIMQERVTNGAMKLYDEFKDSVHWWANKPVIPPHAQGDPPVNHTTKKAGKVLAAWLNPEKKSIDGATLFYNARIAPNDLKRMWEGEKFGNSPGYYCNDEALPGTWEGIEYKTTERGPYYPDHLSMVPRGACPLPHCGFNIDVPVDEAKIARLLDGIKLNFEVNEMSEIEKPAETLKVNAEVKPKETPIEPPKVNVEIDLSTVLNKIDALAGDFAAFKTNAEADKAEIARLKAAEEVRVNAQKATEDALVVSTLTNMLLPAFKDKATELLPAFKANAALWIAQNPDKIDLASFVKPAQIVPAGQAFVPHVNAADEEAEFSALGVASPEDIGKTMKGVI